jgi:hypothetical protein
MLGYELWIRSISTKILVKICCIFQSLYNKTKAKNQSVSLPQRAVKFYPNINPFVFSATSTLTMAFNIYIYII